MKVLFLDHDGVICCTKQFGTRLSKKSKEKGEIFDQFCPKAIDVLNEILFKTDAEIVVTSSWRTHCDLEYMKKIYSDRGIIKEPIGFTRDLENVWDPKDDFNEYKDFYVLSSSIRIKEIKTWLAEHPEVDQWVVVDDLNMKKLGKNFVLCPSENEGIKRLGIKDSIIRILGEKQ